MIHPKLTRKTLEGLLTVYDVKIKKTRSGFYIYPPSDYMSASFFEDLLSICDVFGFAFYVANKADGTLYVDMF